MLASAPATAGSGGSVPDTPHSDPPSSSGSAQAVIEITDTSTPQPAGVCHGSTEGSHPRTSSVATTSTAKPPTTEPDPVKNPNLSLGHKNHGWSILNSICNLTLVFLRILSSAQFFSKRLQEVPSFLETCRLVQWDLPRENSVRADICSPRPEIFCCKLTLSLISRR
mgnify:CR=1 FL=1